METVTKPEPDIELNLLLVEDPAGDWRRQRAAGVGSVSFHVVLVLVLLFVKVSPQAPRPPERFLVTHVTPLYTPPELTQKAPNKAPLAKELTVESIAPRPVFKAPAPAPSAAPSVAKVEPLRARPLPPAAPKEIEAPKIEAPVLAMQTAQMPKTGQLPPQPQDAPKLALQDVNPVAHPGTGRGAGLIMVPNPSIQEAVRAMSHTGGAAGAQTIGDPGADESGSGPGLNLPPSAGRPRSSLELKSDPMGVDFRPYMLQVIAAVRRNWFAVYPEAARLGQRGQVVLQFAVVKQGLVTKVVFNGQSGAKALDQSAVAAISASNPLPPLPAEFKGDRIVLQMTFLYNMQR